MIARANVCFSTGILMLNTGRTQVFVMKNHEIPEYDA